MNKIFVGFFLTIATAIVIAGDIAPKYKFYGFVRNDFYVNSRLNEESTDGLYNFFPKPQNIVNGEDLNEVANSEMLSAYTRMGLDITGEEIEGIKVSAKIESDFAGTSTNYYLLRIRQAYINFAWDKSSLLVGQTWHPLFTSAIPTMVSINTGTPFQPFNRSPQITYTYDLGRNWNIKGAAIYQNQYASYGPNGCSTIYLKNSILPNLYAGLEYKNGVNSIGLAVDYKRIKPSAESFLHSASAMLYGNYTKNKLQIKAKSIIGENLSDMIMTGGYAVAPTGDLNKTEYTNLNTLHNWINVVYGQKVQVGIFAGSSTHLGSNKELDPGITVYGRGYYSTGDEMISNLWRVAPFIIKNIGKIKIGAEYNFTSATYGQLQSSGDINDTYMVNNHRIIGLIMYQF